MESGRLKPRSRAPWNPLRCDGTTLPAGWLLAAKLLAFAVFRGPQFLGVGPPFLPFVSVLDAAWVGPWLAPATAALFLAAFVCLMFNRVVQPACLVMAGCVLVHVAGHRLEYANNLMFACVFLLLIGLYDNRIGLWSLRIQLAIVYGGASLNKALDPDWWNGRFFDTLMTDALHVRWYEAVASRFSPHAIGTVGGIAAIATEATVCLTVLATRNGGVGVLLMLAFHVAMLAATRGQLSLSFTYASLAVAAPFFFPVVSGWSQRIEPAVWWAAAFAIRAIPHLATLV